MLLLDVLCGPFDFPAFDFELDSSCFELLLDFLTWDFSDFWALDFFHHEEDFELLLDVLCGPFDFPALDVFNELDSSCFELLLESLVCDFSDFELEYLLSELLDDY